MALFRNFGVNQRNRLCDIQKTVVQTARDRFEIDREVR